MTTSQVPVKRYIKCRKKVMQFKDIAAAKAALPRIRRADAVAKIVPLDETLELLKQTPSADVILTK